MSDSNAHISYGITCSTFVFRSEIRNGFVAIGTYALTRRSVDVFFLFIFFPLSLNFTKGCDASPTWPQVDPLPVASFMLIQKIALVSVITTPPLHERRKALPAVHTA